MILISAGIEVNGGMLQYTLRNGRFTSLIWAYLLVGAARNSQAKTSTLCR